MRAILIGLAIASGLGASSLATTPLPNPGRDIMTRAPGLEEDYARAVVDGLGRSTRSLSQTLAATRPWDDLGAFCNQPLDRRLNTVGDYFSAHVEPPPPSRDMTSEIRAMVQMNQTISQQLNLLPSRFPPPGRAIFLSDGQTLSSRVSNWGQALAQRAEWALVLHSVGDATRSSASGTTEFAHNYAAMIWSSIECDLISGNRGFLQQVGASGEDISDPRQRHALEFLGQLQTTP